MLVLLEILGDFEPHGFGPTDPMWDPPPESHVML